MIPVGGHRVGRCARFAVRGGAAPLVRQSGDGPAYLAGVAHCGSIHACPSCAARIRAERAREIERAVTRHLAGGGLAMLATLTAPHHRGQTLDDLWDCIAGSWRSMIGGRRRARLRELGFLGFIRALDTTNGGAGWHPHLHVLLLFERDLDADELAVVARELATGWRAGLARHGIPAPRLAYAFNLGTVRNEAALGQYLAKVRGAADEIARSDRKLGRGGPNRTPFEILRDFMADGLERDWRLYAEWIEGSAGRRAIEWSRGLRARLLDADEGPSDDEIVAEQTPGARDLCRFSRETWQAIVRAELLTPRGALVARFLAAITRDGVPGGLACLAAAGIIAAARGPTDGSGLAVLVLLTDRSPTARGTRR